MRKDSIGFCDLIDAVERLQGLLESIGMKIPMRELEEQVGREKIELAVQMIDEMRSSLQQFI